MARKRSLPSSRSDCSSAIDSSPTRRVLVGGDAVQEEDVDVVGLQAGQALLQRLAKRAAGLEQRLGRQHDVVAAAGQRFADDLLGAVGPRRVNEVDAEVEGAADHRDRIGLGRAVGLPQPAVSAAAQPGDADGQSGSSQSSSTDCLQRWAHDRTVLFAVMPNAVIVDAVRTPIGKRNGVLRDWHPVDLAAETLRALVERNDLDPALVEDVVMGCTMTVGEQAMNIGRNAALAAGFPDTVPGTTVDRQCGSAQQAVHFAAQAVMSGAMDVVIGARRRVDDACADRLDHRAGAGRGVRPRVFASASSSSTRDCRPSSIAEKWGVTREDMDRFALQSHEQGGHALSTKAGSKTRSSPSASRRSTRACAAAARSRSWVRCRPRSSRGALSPRRLRRRSPTAPPRCW